MTYQQKPLFNLSGAEKQKPAPVAHQPIEQSSKPPQPLPKCSGGCGRTLMPNDITLGYPMCKECARSLGGYYDLAAGCMVFVSPPRDLKFFTPAARVVTCKDNQQPTALDYYYAWRNNEKRGTLYGRRLRVIARGVMNSALVEFEDGQREIISRNALRRVADEPVI